MIPESWKPQLLFLLPTPHSRLYVEVDAVEGCEPKDFELERLREFLTKYCNKPDGIEIVRSDVISLEAARGIPEKALARRFLNGPAGKTNPSPAFLYILFYDDSFCKDLSNSAVAPNTATVASGGDKVTNPYADIGPYPAIYFNRGYFPGYFRAMRKHILPHEAGHIIGLVRRPSRVAGYHCPKRTCLMNSTLGVSRVAVGFQKKYCNECEKELTQNLRSPPLSNVRFVGPVVVRAEADYHVLSLPGRIAIDPGNLTEHDCHDFAARVRAEQSSDRDWRIDCQIEEDDFKDPAKLNEFLEHLKTDPVEPVREISGKGLQIAARHYDLSRRYSEAIAALRQALLADSNDADSYNNLAWNLATCPDESVRNGKEAVLAATKACELTEWKNRNYVDTLAAAYAECADFQHAIEFQERALRMGNPNEAEQKEMRERLSLYQNSKPFRYERSGRTRSQDDAASDL